MKKNAGYIDVNKKGVCEAKHKGVGQKEKGDQKRWSPPSPCPSPGYPLAGRGGGRGRNAAVWWFSFLSRDRHAVKKKIRSNYRKIRFPPPGYPRSGSMGEGQGEGYPIPPPPAGIHFFSWSSWCTFLSTPLWLTSLISPRRARRRKMLTAFAVRPAFSSTRTGCRHSRRSG